MTKHGLIKRRGFVKLAAGALAAIPVVSAVADEQAERLSEDDPQAVALAYTSDSTLVDSSVFPGHEPAQTCAGCSLFTVGDAEDWGDCVIFPGKQVSASGWCSAYSAKVT